MSQLVTRCNAQFRNIANIYPGNLDYQVLEDAYLCYEIGITYLQLSFLNFLISAKRLPSCPLVASRATRGGTHLDVEHLCSQAVPVLRIVCSDNYKGHLCKEIGCENRAVVIDGNEKNQRKLCKAPSKHIEVKDPKEGKVNFYELCTSSLMLNGSKCNGSTLN